MDFDLIIENAVAMAQGPRFSLDEILFKEQLAFVNDEARFATAVCSVRAGKTTACAADLINTALTMPGTTGLYITLARTSAERIVWPELHRMASDHGVECDFNETKLTVKFPNSSTIYCLGANTPVEIEKLRGLSNVALAYIDESQVFRSHLKELVEEILVKRLYDTNGRCRLIGTPGPVPGGYFYDCSQSPKWSNHAWTLHNNPHIERKSGLSVGQLIQQDMDRKGVTVDDPSIQRECFGRWVLDLNSLLLEFNPEKNHFDVLPAGLWHYILGVDLGFNDADALAVLAYSDTSPQTFLVEEIITPKQTLDSLIAQIADVTKRYQVNKIRADAGGLGLKLIETIIARYPFPIEAAEKQGKLANYTILNNALRTGNFMARKNTRFAGDCNLLERDRDKSTPEKVVVKGHSDIVDAVLYAFKESPAYYWTPPVKQPQPGTIEYAKQIEEKHLEAAMGMAKRDQELRENKSDFGSWSNNKRGIGNWNEW